MTEKSTHDDPATPAAWVRSYDPGVPADVELPDGTAVDLLERSLGEFGPRTALHFLGTSLTFTELADRARRFARALADRGVGPGDVVAVNLPNVPQYLIAQLGATLAGCATSGVSPLLTAEEMAYQLADCKAKALVTLDAIFEKRLAGVADRLGDLRLVVPTGVLDFLPGWKRGLARLFKKVPSGSVFPLAGKEVLPFLRLLADHPPRPPDFPRNPDDVILVQYTGGTTGFPKGAMLTHRNFLANLTQFGSWFGLERGREMFLSGFPFFHLAGLGVGLLAGAIGATQVLIPDPRDHARIIAEMARHRPTFMANVPSLYMMLLDQPEFRRLDFSRLRHCLSGAAPFPPAELERLDRTVGAGKVVEVYGMTETSPLITMNPCRGRKKVGTVGLPIPSTTIRLVDLETGTKDVPPGEEGELIVDGPQVMKGYLGKPEETAKVLRDHDGRVWLHTGDVARVDGDGFVTLVDRAKDMLIVGGFKVFSTEVEARLHTHPAIAHCAIVGVPNPQRPGNDVVKLVVQRSLGHRERPAEGVREEILAFARENLSPYKVPKIVEFIDSMPLTAVGKVDKKALRKPAPAT